MGKKDKDKKFIVEDILDIKLVNGNYSINFRSKTLQGKMEKFPDEQVHLGTRIKLQLLKR